MLVVPFYGALLLKYGSSLVAGVPDESIRFWSCVLFAFVALTDALDGFLARALDQKSELGAYLDPFADKVLLLTSIIFMAEYTEDWWQLPLWLLVIVVARDVLIIYGVWVLKWKRKPIFFRPHWVGKVCTGFQIAVVSFYLLQWLTLGYITAYLAAFFTIWSGIIYFRHGWHLLHLPSETEDEHKPLFKFK